MPAKRQESIPAFLSFDVEPDAFQLSREDASPWSGYGAFYEFSKMLREELARATGAKPVFGWYFRMDPQIDEVLGRADDALARFPDRVESLRAEGDCFGVHSHLLRWSAERRLWVHDLADRSFIRECTAFSLDAFERAMGSPARLFRNGGSFLSDDIFDVLEARGVEAELGLEPGSGGAHGPTSVPCGVDESPVLGRFPDCGAAPREAYFPDRSDFRRRGGEDARPIAVVPMSTAPWRLPPSPFILRLRRLVGRARKPRRPRVLYLSGEWPDADRFWDLAAHPLSTMERPYLNLGVRTDAPGSAIAESARRLLAALARHPLAERLRFVSPLDALDRLLPREAVSVADRS